MRTAMTDGPGDGHGPRSMLLVTDACASHAGREFHRAGLLLLGRFIGARQLKSLADFI